LKLSVIIPVYDEKGTVREVIRRVKEVNIDKEIIVVDDGSIDGTREVLREEYEKAPQALKVHYSPTNMGKGAAIRVGLSYVTGDLVIIQDADLELDPNEYYQLVKPIVEGKTSVVYGSRFLKKAGGISIKARIANKLLALLTNLLYHVNITDEATAYKVFRTDVIKGMDLQCIGFEFDSEVTARICRAGYRITEIPISYNPRTAEAGKKLSYIRDGLKAVYTLIRYRFVD
jgi:dolichol-phosphate mannosyltransferase